MRDSVYHSKSPVPEITKKTISVNKGVSSYTFEFKHALS